MAFSFSISPELSSTSASSMFPLQDLHHGFGAFDDLFYRLDSCLLQLFFRNCWCITSLWSIFHPCATAPHRRFLSSVIPSDSSINITTLGAGTNAGERILTGIYSLLLSLNSAGKVPFISFAAGLNSIPFQTFCNISDARTFQIFSINATDHLCLFFINN